MTGICGTCRDLIVLLTWTRSCLPLPEARGGRGVRPRRRHLVMWVNVILLAGYTFRALVPARVRRSRGRVSARRHAATALALHHRLNEQHPDLAGCRSSASASRTLHPPGLHGHHPGPEDHLNGQSRLRGPRARRHVIGAGGAGLRAAIEAAAQGVSSGSSASRSSARPTRDGEGGSRRPRQRCGPRTTGRSTSATRCAAQDANNWRMAQLHVRRRRSACWSWRAGAAVRRTKTGASSSATSRPSLRATGPRRRPTGLEMIRTLQYHGIHQGIDCTWSARSRACQDGDRVVGAVGLLARERALVSSGRKRWSGHGWYRPRRGRSRRTPGVHRRRPSLALWPAPTSSTWNSCNSTRRGWCGLRRRGSSSRGRARRRRDPEDSEASAS